MSSRQEEKARRRAEREEAERKAAGKQQNAKRIQIVGGVVLSLAAVGAVVAVIAGAGGDDGAGGKAKAADNTSVKLPAAVITDLDQAAKAAGCVVTNPKDEGRGHTTSPVTYKTNPPTSGQHNPVAAEDGIYDPGNEPSKEHTVHALEHGRIELQYKPGTPAATIAKLEALGSEPLNGTNGYHMLVFQNQTKMPYAVAATAWTHSLTCKTFTPEFYDAFRAFRKKWTDKAPELIP